MFNDIGTSKQLNSKYQKLSSSDPVKGESVNRDDDNEARHFPELQSILIHSNINILLKWTKIPCFCDRT